MSRSPRIRVGQLGAGFIGQMHSLAMRNAALARRSDVVHADLVALADANEELLAEVADRFGWDSRGTTWRSVLEHDLDLFVNAGPNDLHHEPSVTAAEAGVHVFSEKPLGPDADTAFRTWQGVEARGVHHRCAFMQRYIPALQLARQMLAAGEIGEVRHFRSRFLMDMLGDGAFLTWRFDRTVAGFGALGDLGSHHIDLARFLVGEVTEVQGRLGTWAFDPTGRVTDVNDDWFAAIATLETGATASFEASRVAAGHGVTSDIEIDGTRGSLRFSAERLNELVIVDPGGTGRTQMVTRASDPYAGFWLPPGLQGNHPLGWNDCFVHQFYDVLDLVANDNDEGLGATFRDGYRVAEIVEAVAESAESGGRIAVEFRG